MTTPTIPHHEGMDSPNPKVPPPTERAREDEAPAEREGQTPYENAPKWPGGGKKGENEQP